ncbi:hypothetical protein P3T37_002688 [Kitasatospora sp. MAA4]|uniref:hypothetical protein n=1 Tax=Kitasatospora sp. MAA4 TaxID=3035093 RepID=UPI002476C828|nr:hypothetical protein [Kitasatospora sp. MAA4]MDH6133293.1 hypothetical protein [Kitasatospora sp. MAA4]
MADSYQVDPNALKNTAKGINDAVAELKTLGIDESAEVGRGFSSLSLTGMQVGNAGLQSALDDFCGRWGWGVRTLVHDGTEIADRLGLSAGRYYDQEQYASGVMKDVVNAAIGNPDLTQEQVEKQSWSQTWDNNPYTQVTNPDYSKASFDQAAADTRKTWAAEGKDIEGHVPVPGLPGAFMPAPKPGGKG